MWTGSNVHDVVSCLFVAPHRMLLVFSEWKLYAVQTTLSLWAMANVLCAGHQPRWIWPRQQKGGGQRVEDPGKGRAVWFMVSSNHWHQSTEMKCKCSIQPCRVQVKMFNNLLGVQVQVKKSKRNSWNKALSWLIERNDYSERSQRVLFLELELLVDGPQFNKLVPLCKIQQFIRHFFGRVLVQSVSHSAAHNA